MQFRERKISRNNIIPERKLDGVRKGEGEELLKEELARTVYRGTFGSRAGESNDFEKLIR